MPKGNKEDKLPSIDDLEKSIEKAKKTHEKKEAPQSAPVSPMRISVELLSGVIVGATIGFFLDRWLNTTPLFFLLCFFLGVAGSGLNIYKIARKLDQEEEL